MPSQKINLEQLIEKSSYLFRTRGYHYTSISDIASYCNLSKASVYHYMPSKQALGAAVIKELHRSFRNEIFSIAFDEDLNPADRLKKYARKLENFFEDREGGCLVGNLALEVTGIIPEFEKLIREFFVEWIASLKQLISGKFSDQESQVIAEETLAQIQGALMVQRLFSDPKQLKRASARVAELLD